MQISNVQRFLLGENNYTKFCRYIHFVAAINKFATFLNFNEHTQKLSKQFPLDLALKIQARLQRALYSCCFSRGGTIPFKCSNECRYLKFVMNTSKKVRILMQDLEISMCQWDFVFYVICFHLGQFMFFNAQDVIKFSGEYTYI